MSAATYNFPTVYTGDDVSQTFTFTSDGSTPINITGRTYSAGVYDGASSVASFTCTNTTGTDGKVVLSLANATTTSLGVGQWRWSLVENASGIISTLLVGSFTIASEVTG